MYDALSNRLEKDVNAGGTTTVTRFAYDDAGNAWADLNGSSSLTTRRVYLDGPDSVAARISGSALSFYLPDRLGSIRNQTDASGVLSNTITYDGFGKVTSETSSSNGDRFKFTGRELDSETDLQYQHARYYDPATGKWTTIDPTGFGAGDPNLYRYVGNAPTNDADPAGLQVGGTTVRPSPPTIRPTNPWGPRPTNPDRPGQGSGSGTSRPPRVNPWDEANRPPTTGTEPNPWDPNDTDYFLWLNGINKAIRDRKERVHEAVRQARKAGVPQSVIDRIIGDTQRPRIQGPNSEEPDTEALRRLHRAIRTYQAVDYWRNIARERLGQEEADRIVDGILRNNPENPLAELYVTLQRRFLQAGHWGNIDRFGDWVDQQEQRASPAPQTAAGGAGRRGQGLRITASPE